MRQVSIYTDGSYSVRTGYGGWGAVVVHPRWSMALNGGCLEKTNSLRMELIAILNALDWLDGSCKVLLYTDCLHIKNCITRNLPRWKATGWMNNKGLEVADRDLWIRLDYLCNNVHVVVWNWVRGHNGDRYNERADRLAREGRRTVEKRLKRR